MHLSLRKLSTRPPSSYTCCTRQISRGVDGDRSGGGINTMVNYERLNRNARLTRMRCIFSIISFQCVYRVICVNSHWPRLVFIVLSRLVTYTDFHIHFSPFFLFSANRNFKQPDLINFKI